MPKRVLFPVIAIVCTLTWSETARAEPRPVPPIEIERGQLHEPRPFASPGGSQLVTWIGQGTDVGLHLAERGPGGGPFGPPVSLSGSGNLEPPSISFTQNDGFYAIWGVATSGVPAETIIRAPDGSLGPLGTVPGCDRFVDSASGPAGEIAMACKFRLATNPPDTVRWGSTATLGPVTPTEDLTPPAYSNFLKPSIEWGPDGTIAIVSDGRTTTTDPPPMNETTRIRVSIRGSAPFATQDIAFATWPQEVDAGPPLVLDDGTVAVPLAGSEGARLALRPPGAPSVFAPVPLQGEGIWGAGVDTEQRIHVASGVAGDRQYWSFVKPRDGGFGAANPIPMPVVAGGGDAYLIGFEVAPDGTEYAIIRADDGTYATSRSPGLPFTEPVRLGSEPSGNAEGALTGDGDLLVAWAHEQGPTDRSIELSGLDKTPPQVSVNAFPTRMTDGETAAFSATATDAMGIGSLAWSFDGRIVQGGDATHAFVGPGPREVAFTATDVAGQKTVVKRTVEVAVGPGSKPLLTLKTPRKIRFRALRKRGLRIVVTGRPPVRLRVALGASRSKAGLRPLRARVVRKFRNRHVLRIKPRRARLGKRRAFRLHVQVTGTTKAGRQTTKAKAVRVRR